MNSSSFCPFGCDLPYPNVDKIICHGRCNVKTMDRGTQTGPTFEDFYTEDEERQFIAIMMQKTRFAAALSATRREVEEGRRLRHQIAELERDLYGRPADRHGQREEVAIEDPVVENAGRQQNLAEIQQPPLEDREQQPRQVMMEVRLAQQDLAALQPPVLDFPENLRIQEELVERKRPRLELVVGEQPPRELFEPQPESAKRQQSQQQLAEGQLQQESFENEPQPQSAKGQQSKQNVVQEHQLEQKSVESEQFKQ